MPITITTLNNSSAVAKTFSEVGKDRVSAEYLNTTDTTSNLDSRLQIKQQLVGKSQGIPIRRSLIQVTWKALDAQNGTLATPEVITINLTVTGPTILTTLTATQRRDAVAFLKNLLSDENVDRLARGEV